MSQDSAAIVAKANRKNPIKLLGDWRLYAAAGSASLAAGTSADAGIIHQSYNVTLTPTASANTASYQFAIGNLGGFNAVAKNISVTSKPRRYNFAQISNAPSVIFGSVGTIRNFAGGAAISGTATNTNNWLRARFENNGTGGGDFNNGNFGLNQTGYAGFVKNGYYGWIRVRVNDAGNTGWVSSLTLIDAAYNDVLGTPILAGQTVTAAVPEPGTMAMGLLASGAAGLVALRRAKAKAAETQAATPAA